MLLAWSLSSIFPSTPPENVMLDLSGPMSTIDRARLLEKSAVHPEDILFAKLLEELGNQSAERVRSSAMKMDLASLKNLVTLLSEEIDTLKGESARDLLRQMKSEGFETAELQDWLASLKTK